jgi:hypothetical protein
LFKFNNECSSEKNKQAPRNKTKSKDGKIFGETRCFLKEITLKSTKKAISPTTGPFPNRCPTMLKNGTTNKNKNKIRYLLIIDLSYTPIAYCTFV